MFRSKLVFVFLVSIFVISLSSCKGCRSDTRVAVCYYEKIMCDELDSKPFWNSSSHECSPMDESKCLALATSQEEIDKFCNEDNFKIGQFIIINPVFFSKGLCQADKKSKQDKGACFFNEKKCVVTNDIYSQEQSYHLCLDLTAEECQDLQDTCDETCSINAIDKDSFCTDNRSSDGDLFKYDFKYVAGISCPSNSKK